MANAQYNEVTNDVQPWTNLDPMYSRSTVLRVKPSRLQCPTQTQHRRGRMLSRCLTQPVTFIEIQEAEDEESCGMSGAAPQHGASKEVIWSRFEEFSRRVDSRLSRNDSAGDTDSEHSTTTVGSSHPLPDSPDTTSGSHLLQEYERRRRRSQRQKRTTSIEELPETEKGD